MTKPNVTSRKEWRRGKGRSRTQCKIFVVFAFFCAFTIGLWTTMFGWWNKDTKPWKKRKFKVMTRSNVEEVRRRRTGETNKYSGKAIDILSSIGLTGLFQSFSSIWRGRQRRIAIVIPYMHSREVAAGFPAYFDAFIATAGGSASLIDFFIFHDGIEKHLLPLDRIPPNVFLIDVEGPVKMAQLLTRVLDRRSPVDMKMPMIDVVNFLSKQLMTIPYLLVEFKGAMGHIFQDYIAGYSHWGYSDIDVLLGDLPRWITDDELENYDIVTYGFGDQHRFYLRGQFTFHKNAEKTNQIWRSCKYLSEMDERLFRVRNHMQKMSFESAEGCYSHAAVTRKDLRIKYAVKAFSDVDDKDSANNHGLFVGIGKKRDRAVLYKAGPQSGDGRKLLQLPYTWFETDEATTVAEDHSVSVDPSQGPLQWEVGQRTRVETHRDHFGDDQPAACMFWALRVYQKELCAAPGTIDSSYTVFLEDGVLYKQKYEMAPLPADIRSFPVFHFQEWKRGYRSDQLAPLRHSHNVLGWAMMKEGAVPILADPLSEKSKEGSLLSSSSTSLSIARDTVSAWADTVGVDRSRLPSTVYCLQSIKHPKKGSTCSRQVAWQNTAEVNILSTASNTWDAIDIFDDVTLVMTLQFTFAAEMEDGLEQSEMGSYGSELQRLDHYLKIAEWNIRKWGTSQPCILLIHVGGANSLLIDATIRRRFEGSRKSPKPHLNCCLVASVLSSSTDEVSRKTLLNMGTEAAATRWVLSGIELERGLVLSQDVAAHVLRRTRASQTMTGQVFYIPQFAVTQYSGVVEEENGMLTADAVVAGMDKGELEMTPEMYPFDCAACSPPPKGSVENERALLSRFHELWFNLTRAEFRRDMSQPSDVSYSTNGLAKRLEVLHLFLMGMLSKDYIHLVHKFDVSPILLVDNVGPRRGMITLDLSLEVERFGGSRCYNALRWCQLAALGYHMNVLPGVVALSTPQTRQGLCLAAGADSTNSTASARRHKKAGGRRCDDCIMFDANSDALYALIRGERIRPIKSVVFWHDQEFFGRRQ